MGGGLGDATGGAMLLPGREVSGSNTPSKNRYATRLKNPVIAACNMQTADHSPTNKPSPVREPTRSSTSPEPKYITPYASKNAFTAAA